MESHPWTRFSHMFPKAGEQECSSSSSANSQTVEQFLILTQFFGLINDSVLVHFINFVSHLVN